MQESKLSRRIRERLRRRRQMLAAAMELFADKGYHNVSMHEIASRSEFAIGTLYKFFRNKEDLYKVLLLEKAEELHNTLIGILSGTGDFITVLDAYLDAKATFFANNINLMKLYFAETQGASFNLTAGLNQDIRDLYKGMTDQLVRFLERHAREHTIRDLDPHHMALALEGISNTFLFHTLENPNTASREASLAAVRELFLKGVLAQ